MFRLASDTMDDDAALVEILAANDELTVVVNAYKDQMGRRECNGGSESRSEEEVASKNNGGSAFCTHSFSSGFPVDNNTERCLVPLCSACFRLSLLVLSAPRSPREIKSYHLIDLSALDSPQTHRKPESPPPSLQPPLLSSHLETFHSVTDHDFNELGRAPFVHTVILVCSCSSDEDVL